MTDQQSAGKEFYHKKMCSAIFDEVSFALLLLEPPVMYRVALCATYNVRFRLALGSCSPSIRMSLIDPTLKNYVM